MTAKTATKTPEQLAIELAALQREKKVADLRAIADDGAAKARRDVVVAQVDALHGDIAELWRQEKAQFDADHDAGQATLKRVKAFLAEPKPTPFYTDQQIRDAAADLGRYVDGIKTAERREIQQHVSQSESRRCWDWDFRRHWDLVHPLGPDKCPCREHRAYRGEDF